MIQGFNHHPNSSWPKKFISFQNNKNLPFNKKKLKFAMNNQPHNIISFNSVCINLLTNEILFFPFCLKKSIFDQSNLLKDMNPSYVGLTLHMLPCISQLISLRLLMPKVRQIQNWIDSNNIEGWQWTLPPRNVYLPLICWSVWDYCDGLWGAQTPSSMLNMNINWYQVYVHNIGTRTQL
jgi:hypothetical protein